MMTLTSCNILFLDIETNGFLQQMDRMWCMAYSNGTEVSLCADPDGVEHEWFMSLADHFDEYDVIVAHNGIGFDFPALHKLYGWKPKAKIVDTLVLSSLLFPDIEGGHSLKAWGMRLNEHKGDYEGGFDRYSEDMGAYCKQDVTVLQKLYNHLMKEYAKDPSVWDGAIAMEHKVAQLISWQERNGWQFDMDGAREFVDVVNAKITDTDEKLRHMLEWKVTPFGSGSAIAPFTAAGAVSARCIAAAEARFAEGLPPVEVGGQFTRINLDLPDLGSRQQMIQLLIKHGWKPTEYTEKGNPRFTEDSIVGKLGDTGQMLVDRFVCVTRRGQVTGWMAKVREDGRIEAGAFPNATPTARMRHRTVVNVPRVGTPYGAELRALFCVPKNKVQVGADASGLELRILAHYMGDEDYTKAVVFGSSKDGTDVHTINCRLIGLDPKKIYEFGNTTTSGRDVAKTFIYALLYGAGDAKLGSIIDGDEKVGARLRKKFLTGLPKYAKLLDRVKAASKKGWIRGLDGRKIFIRHEHAALNSLLQAGGSIAVKMAMCKWADVLIKKRIPFKLIGTFHDEIQAECSPEHADMVGETFCKAMQWVSTHLKMRVTLDGEYKVGMSWLDCH